MDVSKTTGQIILLVFVIWMVAINVFDLRAAANAILCAWDNGYGCVENSRNKDAQRRRQQPANDPWGNDKLFDR